MREVTSSWGGKIKKVSVGVGDRALVHDGKKVIGTPGPGVTVITGNPKVTILVGVMPEIEAEIERLNLDPAPAAAKRLDLDTTPAAKK